MPVKYHCIFVIFMMLTVSESRGQEEEVIGLKARLERSNAFYFTLGAGNSLRQNNYTGGTMVGAGYQKRVNRILSIGASATYTTFRTDYANFMTGKYFDPKWNNSQPNNFYYPADMSEYYLVNLSGGDLRQMYISIPLKVNLIPIKSTTVTSFYGIIAPALVLSQLENVVANENYFLHPSPTEYLQEDNRSYEASTRQSTWKGGVVLSAGVEFFPANLFSFYLQAGLGYSFAVPFVDTSLYQKHTIQEYKNRNFPLSTKKEFSTFNIQMGLSYNF
jgi:hypothetical protein